MEETRVRLHQGVVQRVSHRVDQGGEIDRLHKGPAARHDPDHAHGLKLNLRVPHRTARHPKLPGQVADRRQAVTYHKPVGLDVANQGADQVRLQRGRGCGWRWGTGHEAVDSVSAGPDLVRT